MELNRRTFTALTAGAATALVLPGGTASAVAVPADTASDGAAFGTIGADCGRVRLLTSHTVTFDKYSLLVDGQRMVLWSGEFHPFRLPSPSLWLDVLQKMRAHGYNAVSIYVSWNYHSPAQGVYDFTGVRDLDMFLSAAAAVGIFVTVRPGPYINAEVDAGGFPGWLTATSGTARTNNATYLSHVDEWLTAVDAIVSKHQYTTGGGTVLLYQLENEYSAHLTDGVGSAYMAHLYAKVRADGITVPLFHNDKGRNGDWVPGSFSSNGESGRYLYAFDGYPSPSSTPPDWGYFGPGGATGGSTASPNTPGFEAEFGGGWFDPWGGAEFSGQGYAGARASRDPVYERRFYLTNLANGIKLQNVYMTFGGTSWGWLPAPVVYTSYDYGAAIDEARNLTSKLVPMKQIGLMLETVPDLAELDKAATVAASNSTIKVYHLANPASGAHVYMLRNDSSSDISVTLPVTVPVSGGTSQVTVPASGAGIRLNGKDMKVVATGIAIGRRTLRYTTAQPMYQATVGAQDVALLTGRSADAAEASIGFAAAPKVAVLGGSATTAYDASSAALRVNTQLSGLTRVLITPADGTAPLLLLFADDQTSSTFWRHATSSGPALVRGPSLLRDASVSGAMVVLSGDTAMASDLEVWAPRGITQVLWNGAAVTTAATTSGSLQAKAQLAGPAQVTLPALASWRFSAENPESAPGFNDSGWAVANKTTSFSTTAVPSGQPVLFADDYGFHYGDVWYRASYTGAAGAQSVSLAYSSGTQGMLMAWLDGVPLGSHRQPVPTKAQDTQATWTATATFAIPASLSGSGAHVLAVLVRPMAHSEDGGSNDAHKAARGLTAVTFTGASPALTWRIQGAVAADPLRGPLNNGGLFGERSGWHLPSFNDSGWQAETLPRSDSGQGVGWFRTTFSLSVPQGVDASIGLTLTDTSTRAYRVQIFLNGWNIGQYINDVGPQHTFVLPNGMLHTHGSNTLALAVLRDGTTAAGPGSVSLTLLGSAAGGVAVTDLPNAHRGVTAAALVRPDAAAFGFSSSGGFFTVNTGAGLTFKISQSNGDMTSFVFNGTELTSPSRPSNVESGLGSGASISAVQNGDVIIVTETATNFYGSGTVHHYLVVQSGVNNVYMATYVDSNAAGELRWIQSLNRSVLPNIAVTSDTKGGTAIESTDIFLVGGQTRSKYYGNRQAQNLTVRGVTGNGVGVFMDFGNRESSSGGPFFRDIEQQGTSDSIQVYNYLWSGHNDTEAQRLNVLYGPYALMVTNGSTPTAPDLSFMYTLGLTGSVGASGRGFVVGKAMGVDASTTPLVGFANSTAQYWCSPSASTGNFSSPAMKPGTYTQTLYQGELAVATRSVTVTAGSTTTGQNITSSWSTPASPIFRIGTWDGAPTGFKNFANLSLMHPSDTRDASWGPVTYTVGSSQTGDFPSYQWKDANNPTTVVFTLTSAQLAARTVRIGISAAYAGGRPQIAVNNWTSSAPSPSSQPSSRSLTIGTYRGNNTLFTYAVPASAFVAGTNRMTITVISGSSGSGFLSPGYSYDCVEMS